MKTIVIPVKTKGYYLSITGKIITQLSFEVVINRIREISRYMGIPYQPFNPGSMAAYRYYQDITMRLLNDFELSRK